MCCRGGRYLFGPLLTDSYRFTTNVVGANIPSIAQDNSGISLIQRNGYSHWRSASHLRRFRAIRHYNGLCSLPSDTEHPTCACYNGSLYDGVRRPQI
jgi:hypothetical protein